MAWEQPIFDRTEQDVKNVKLMLQQIQTQGFDSLSEQQKEMFLGELRGTLSATTINRINNNIVYLKGKLLQQGYKPTINSTEKNYTYSDYIYFSDLRNLLLDLQSIYQVVNSILPLPNETDLEPLTYQTLNEIEQFIFGVNVGLQSVEQTTVICGDSICGQHITGGSKWKTD